MKISQLIALLMVLIMLTGCGGGAKKSAEEANMTGMDLPSWFVMPPTSDDYLYGIGSATSKLLNVAMERAVLSAKGDVASKVDSKIERLKKDFMESTGLLEEEEIIGQFSQVQKEIVSQELMGVETDQQQMNKDKDTGLLTVYVLVRYPIGKTAQKFLEGISKQKRLYTEFKASKAYDDLKEEIERFEKDQNY